MQKIVTHFFEDILNAAEAIERFVADMNYDDFVHDEKTIRAVERELEILGEAVKHIPLSIRQQYPEVPWRLAAGMRDRLIHHYWKIETAILWRTVQESVPQLYTMISACCAGRRSQATGSSGRRKWRLTTPTENIMHPHIHERITQIQRGDVPQSDLSLTEPRSSQRCGSVRELKRMSVIRVETELPFEKLLQAVEQLSLPDLETLTVEVLNLRARRKAPSLSADESELLLTINQGLSPDAQQRFETLLAKRQAETLTEQEQQELISLTETIEQRDAERLKSLAEFARIRGRSVETIMHDLELS